MCCDATQPVDLGEGEGQEGIGGMGQMQETGAMGEMGENEGGQSGGDSEEATQEKQVEAEEVDGRVRYVGHEEQQGELQQRFQKEQHQGFQQQQQQQHAELQQQQQKQQQLEVPQQQGVAAEHRGAATESAELNEGGHFGMESNGGLGEGKESSNGDEGKENNSDGERGIGSGSGSEGKDSSPLDLLMLALSDKQGGDGQKESVGLQGTMERGDDKEGERCIDRGENREENGLQGDGCQAVPLSYPFAAPTTAGAAANSTPPLASANVAVLAEVGDKSRAGTATALGGEANMGGLREGLCGASGGEVIGAGGGVVGSCGAPAVGGCDAMPGALGSGALGAAFWIRSSGPGMSNGTWGEWMGPARSGETEIVGGLDPEGHSGVDNDDNPSHVPEEF
ncbi:unnamed protein product [Closterium sp. Yama58-4]|nr:unnamed protein product [Closterium sp. Yama58-4]